LRDGAAGDGETRPAARGVEKFQGKSELAEVQRVLTQLLTV
jgi:hypothetical protein